MQESELVTSKQRQNQSEKEALLDLAILLYVQQRVSCSSEAGLGLLKTLIPLLVEPLGVTASPSFIPEQVRFRDAHAALRSRLASLAPCKHSLAKPCDDNRFGLSSFWTSSCIRPSCTIVRLCIAMHVRQQSCHSGQVLQSSEDGDESCWGSMPTHTLTHAETCKGNPNTQYRIEIPFRCAYACSLMGHVTSLLSQPHQRNLLILKNDRRLLSITIF